MIEEPYRWLEAVANRREYVRDQLKDGSPVFAASLPDGILLLGVGGGQTKVFELFDRHALAGLGHPADIEKIRQSAIDAAHTEAFTRAPEDVSLRRLVGFGLSPQLKTNFEQIFSAPFLSELLLAELGGDPGADLLVRLHFEGAFETQKGGVMVAAAAPDWESNATTWLQQQLSGVSDRAVAARRMMEAWQLAAGGKPFEGMAPEPEREALWRRALGQRVVELGWLNRRTERPVRYQPLTLSQVGL